jgi:hypothetical protein
MEQDSKNLLDANQTTEEILENTATNKKLLTEVTSIAKEEEKTGEKIPIPSEEELLRRANMSFLVNRKKFSDIFKTLSSKQKSRVADAILDLPQDKLPVYLKESNEKYAFALGQRIIMDRFTITLHHINEERKKFIKTNQEAKTSEQEKESSNE